MQRSPGRHGLPQVVGHFYVVLWLFRTLTATPTFS